VNRCGNASIEVKETSPVQMCRNHKVDNLRREFRRALLTRTRSHQARRTKHASPAQFNPPPPPPPHTQERILSLESERDRLVRENCVCRCVSALGALRVCVYPLTTHQPTRAHARTHVRAQTEGSKYAAAAARIVKCARSRARARACACAWRVRSSRWIGSSV
jgi:hypothetical protein